MVEAVAFDLFDTLIIGLNREKYHVLIDHIAQVMQADPKAIREAWLPTQPDRMIGANGSVLADIEKIAMYAGFKPSKDLLEEAASIKTGYFRDHLVPRPGAIEAIDAIRAKGKKVSCLTNCSKDIEDLWPKSAFHGIFDDVVFSSDVGLAKPDPEIYRIAAERLGLSPEQVLFVGDGANHELTGAKKANMPALMLTNDYIPVAVTRETDWEHKVSDLRQVADFMDRF